MGSKFKSATRIPPSERYRHEGYLPQIISKEQWQAAQTLLRTQARSSYGNKPSHRYAGLLRCKDCGNVFVPMIRIWKGKKRVEYVCRGYQRNGKDFCSSHRIHEEVLDQQVTSFVLSLRDQYVLLQHRLLLLQKVWVLNQPRLSATIQELENKVQALEADIDYILMEKIQLHS